MQIWFLSNGSYSLKKCHNPFGKAIQPPPPYGKIPVEHVKSLRGASLSSPSYARPPVNVTNGDGKKISLPHQI